MASLALAVSDGSVSIGRVFDRALATLRHNPMTTVTLAILFGGLPAAGFNYLTNQVPSEYLVMTFGSWVLPGAIAVLLVQLFFAQLVGVIAQGAITLPVVAQAEGGRISLGESLAKMASAFLPLIGLGLLVGTGIVIGLTLLIIPALVIYLLWALAAPALVAERDGVFLAITRSQELSEGARWKCAGALLVPFAISLLIGMLASFVWRFLLGMSPMIEGSSTGIIGYWVLLGAFSNLMWALVQASLYVELREWKDGPPVSGLEEIFS